MGSLPCLLAVLGMNVKPLLEQNCRVPRAPIHASPPHGPSQLSCPLGMQAEATARHGLGVGGSPALRLEQRARLESDICGPSCLPQMSLPACLSLTVCMRSWLPRKVPVPVQIQVFTSLSWTFSNAERSRENRLVYPLSGSATPGALQAHQGLRHRREQDARRPHGGSRPSRCLKSW